MKIEGERWIFSTGRWVRSDGMFTYFHDDTIAEGYDNSLIPGSADRTNTDDLTPQEAFELAEQMILHWTAFRDRAAKRRGAGNAND